ncbi:MAG: OmpA family protein [Patescibacteria group bacterium]
MKKGIILYFLFLTTCWSLFAQESNPANNADSESNAVIIFNDNSKNTSLPDLIGATPGVAGSLLPNYFYEKGEWKIYFPAVSNLQEMTREQIGNMIGRPVKVNKKAKMLSNNMRKKVKGTIYKKGNCTQKPLSIHLTNYPIKMHTEPGDEIWATVMIEGEHGWPREKYLAMADAWSYDENICSNRASVITMDLAEGVTRGRSIGFGGAGATPIDTSGTAAAVGGFIGTNRGRREVKPVFEVAFLNEGPFLATVKKDDDNGDGSKKNVLIPPLSLSENPTMSYLKKMAEDMADIAKNLSMPPVININNVPATNLPPLSPPALQQAVQISGDDKQCSGLPPFEILFDFNKSDVKTEYLSDIRRFSEWQKSHKGCRLQVEGHTCSVGSISYNANLARNRAKSVYDLFVADGVTLEQFVSLSKDKATSERNPKDRRVIVRIIGNTSGK